MRIRFLPTLLTAVFITASLSLFPLNTFAQNAAPGQTAGDLPEEVRGVWITNVDSDVMRERRKLEDAMDYLAENGINVVFPVVWNRGFTLHHSEVMDTTFGFPQVGEFRRAGRDPLREIMTEAHRVGMEVIPWFEYGFAGSHGGTNHIFQRKPEWAARNIDGGIAIRNGFLWMNGFKPEVQNFMLDLIREVMENYDIDGIQGDDRLPALPHNAGYSDYTVQRYQDEHDGEDPPEDMDDPDFIQWRADILTEFGGQIYDMVKDYDQHLTVSMSPSIFPWSRDNYLQDWPAWIEAGQVDIVHPQAYRYELGQYQSLIRQMVGSTPDSETGHVPQKYKHKISPGIVSGVGGNLNPPDVLIDKVSYNREFGIKGEVYFFYETLRARNNHALDSIAAVHYQEMATLPTRNGTFRRVPGIVSHQDNPLHVVQGEWEADELAEGSVMGSLKAEAGFESTIEYFVDVPAEAHYRVYTYIPYEVDGNSEVRYAAVDASGDTTAVVLDQSSENIQKRGWTPVGEVYLQEGEQQVALLEASASSGEKPVYGDAVMIILDRKRSPDVEISRDVAGEPDDRQQEVPQQVSLEQNYPNPFNPSTEIRFELPESGIVTLEVYDMLGRKVTTLIDSEHHGRGGHQVTFDATDLSSGVYIYRLQTEHGVLSRSMSFVK